MPEETGDLSADKASAAPPSSEVVDGEGAADADAESVGLVAKEAEEKKLEVEGEAAEGKDKDDGEETVDAGKDGAGEDGEIRDCELLAKPAVVVSPKGAVARRTGKQSARKPFNSKVWDLPVKWSMAVDRKAQALLEIVPAKEGEYLAEYVNCCNACSPYSGSVLPALVWDRFETRSAESIEKFIEANTKKEGEAVFRCLLPPLKRFKVCRCLVQGSAFWQCLRAVPLTRFCAGTGVH